MSQSVKQSGAGVSVTYPCKFSHRKCYSKDDYSCNHGGGVACKTWRDLTDQELFGEGASVFRKFSGSGSY